MVVKTSPFDAAEHLDSPQAIAEFLADAFESGHAGVISGALGAVARAKGMTELAKEAGVSRQSLYESLAEDGRPEFSTVMRVLAAVGVTLKPTVNA